MMPTATLLSLNQYKPINILFKTQILKAFKFPTKHTSLLLPFNSGNLQKQSTKHTNVAETYLQNQQIKALLRNLQKNGSSDPLVILRDEGDWSKEQFWAVIRFLLVKSRAKEALQVFNLWKDIEKSRINEANYTKIIQFFCEAGLVEEAVLALQEMETYGLSPSSAIYNKIIHGFARKGEFEYAKSYVKKMGEVDLMPEPETYNGLIEAYGNYKMYDEMGKCLKKMESDGCSPDDYTYNILIRELARGGLLERMERIYRTLLSKRMNLQSITLIAMLEAYADLGILGKMEKVYRRILNSKAFLKEGPVRKMAGVFIDNYRFSRLEEFGHEIASRTGRNDLVWCILLLSSACLLSRKGMESVVHEMDVAKVNPNITYTNIIALAYMKMNDLRHLDILLTQLRARNVKPDIVTVGILFDACSSGFNGSVVLDVWRKLRFLEEAVELNTDPLVLAAFGKGFFLRSCEEMYSALGSKARAKKVWTYNDLINLVSEHNGRNPQFM